jgi:hypothetical protein
MKKIKITYRIIKGIFAAYMFLSAIPEMLAVPDAVTMITILGYPEYFVRFIGVAKLLGVIAILIPGFKIIKEWAYAGLFYDLIGATYSATAKGGFDPRITFMVLPLGFLFLSYYPWHKEMKTA